MQGDRITKPAEQEWQQLGRSPWRPSFQLYLIFMNLILLGLLFPALGIVFFRQEAAFEEAQLHRTIEQMRHSLENRSASLVRSMALSAGEAAAGYDFSFLNIMAAEVVENDPEIVYCMIMDTSQMVVAGDNPQDVGRILDSPTDQEAIRLLADFAPIQGDGDFVTQVRFLDHERQINGRPEQVLEGIAPVYSGARLVGVIRCGYTLRLLQSEIAAAKLEWSDKMRQAKVYFATMSVVVFSIGVMVAALFTRPLVRSTRLLNEGAKLFSHGDFDHAVQHRGFTCNEFLRLATTFNEMAVKLKESHEQLSEYSRSLEHKVELRTKELREAQAHLVQQAHEAGMAEMAVGIVHNIGNAITPVKVSSAILTRKLRESPVRNYLQEVMDEIRPVVIGSSGLAQGEKERLLDLMSLLPEGIREEYDRIIEEMDRLRERHEHIEAIIRLQMRYARLSGDFEEVNIDRKSVV